MKRVKIDDGYFHHEIGVITPETRKKLAVRQKFSNFALSIRNTADTLKSQPDTRAGKPNKQQL